MNENKSERRTIAQKMGVKENSRAILVNSDEVAINKIEFPPLDISTKLAEGFDYIHLFVKKQSEFIEHFPILKEYLNPNGMLWVSWPKSGKSGTDLNLKTVIKLGYDFGLVESTCLSISEIWSGLKFTHPKKGKVYNNSYGKLNDKRTSTTNSDSIGKTETFFETQDKFRKWLERHHETETELIVGFYKMDSGKPSMTWSQSVDQALCFGWIDGVRNSIDMESYSIRFTPRRSTSIWSAVNIKKVEELTKAGLMKPAGLKAFGLRTENKSIIYSYEKEIEFLDTNYEKQFRKDKLAWDFFMKQAPSYKKAIIHWIMSAKQEKTRQSRLEKAIKVSGQQKRIV